MLHVTGLTDRTGRYYLDDLAAELGPTRSGAGGLAPGGPGRWTGEGASGLALAGPVEPGDLGAVLEGRRPGGGRPLVARRGAVAAFDLTFTAPKSVSVLFALSPPEVAAEVVTAHDAAVEGAAGYVSRRAVAVRRGTGEERRAEPAGGAVAAAFTHGVSRALDPHLHTHVLVANIGHGADGRWTALDSRGLFAHAGAAGAVYDAELRHRLTDRLGVAWEESARGRYELAGVGPTVLGAFSSRRAEILAEVAESGYRSPRATRVAWARTRDEKAGREPGPLAEHWRVRADAVGVRAGDLSALVGRVRPAPAATVDEHRFAGRVAPEGEAVTRRQAVGAWAGSLCNGALGADIERCADRLADWGDGVGVAEVRRPPGDVVAASHLLGSLGPRPAAPDLLGVWMEGASAVTAYRERWGVTDRARPLGVDGPGGELARLPAQRLADHLATARRVADVRRQLGRALGRQAEPAHLGLGRE